MLLLFALHNCEAVFACAASVVPGAGAFEIAAHTALVKHKEEVKGRARLGECHSNILGLM